MPNQGTESQFKETTIDRLRALGYRYQYGGDIERDWREVVMVDWPINSLFRPQQSSVSGPWRHEKDGQCIQLHLRNSSMVGKPKNSSPQGTRPV